MENIIKPKNPPYLYLIVSFSVLLLIAKIYLDYKNMILFNHQNNILSFGGWSSLSLANFLKSRIQVDKRKSKINLFIGGVTFLQALVNFVKIFS
jgi:hypothetical protein